MIPGHSLILITSMFVITDRGRMAKFFLASCYWFTLKFWKNDLNSVFFNFLFLKWAVYVPQQFFGILLLLEEHIILLSMAMSLLPESNDIFGALASIKPLGEICNLFSSRILLNKNLLKEKLTQISVSWNLKSRINTRIIPHRAKCFGFRLVSMLLCTALHPISPGWGPAAGRLMLHIVCALFLSPREDVHTRTVSLGWDFVFILCGQAEDQRTLPS